MTPSFDYEAWKGEVLRTFDGVLTPAQQLDIANAITRAYFDLPSPLPNISASALDELLVALARARALLTVMQPLTDTLASALEQPSVAALLRHKSH